MTNCVNDLTRSKSKERVAQFEYFLMSSSLCPWPSQVLMPSDFSGQWKAIKCKFLKALNCNVDDCLLMTSCDTRSIAGLGEMFMKSLFIFRWCWFYVRKYLYWFDFFHLWIESNYISIHHLISQWKHTKEKKPANTNWLHHTEVTAKFAAVMISLPSTTGEFLAKEWN